VQLLNAEKWPHWPRLSWYNWQFLLGMYNMSVAGSYVSVLQPIHVAHSVTPDEAMSLRESLNDVDKSFPSHWKSFAAALDPFDFVGMFILKQFKLKIVVAKYASKFFFRYSYSSTTGK